MREAVLLWRRAGRPVDHTVIISRRIAPLCPWWRGTLDVAGGDWKWPQYAANLQTRHTKVWEWMRMCSNMQRFTGIMQNYIESTFTDKPSRNQQLGDFIYILRNRPTYLSFTFHRTGDNRSALQSFYFVMHLCSYVHFHLLLYFIEES